jgi:hypothetical protein
MGQSNRKLQQAEQLIRELNAQLTEGKHLVDTLADKLLTKNLDIAQLNAHADELEERLRTSEEARGVLEQRISELNLAMAFAREGKFADALRELERQPIRVASQHLLPTEPVTMEPRAIEPRPGVGADAVGPERADPGNGASNLDCESTPAEEVRHEAQPSEGDRTALASGQPSLPHAGFFSLAGTSARWNVSPLAQSAASPRAHADQTSADEMSAAGVGGLGLDVRLDSDVPLDSPGCSPNIQPNSPTMPSGGYVRRKSLTPQQLKPHLNIDILRTQLSPRPTNAPVQLPAFGSGSRRVSIVLPPDTTTDSKQVERFFPSSADSASLPNNQELNAVRIETLARVKSERAATD